MWFSFLQENPNDPSTTTDDLADESPSLCRAHPTSLPFRRQRPGQLLSTITGCDKRTGSAALFVVLNRTARTVLEHL